MAATDSGHNDGQVQLPQRPGESPAVSDPPFVPPAVSDSIEAGTMAEPLSSDGGAPADLLAAGLAIALVACLLLVFRAKNLASMLRTTRQERNTAVSERDALRQSLAGLEAAGREQAARGKRLSAQVRALQRDRQNLLESRARLAARAEHDDLTGLLHRRAFEAALGRELRRALREEQALLVMAWTVDEPEALAVDPDKSDRMIQQVATALSAACRRGGDQVARLAETAFAAALPGTDARGAMRIFETARQALDGHKPALALSAGLVEVDAAGGAEPDDILNALDAACGEAKRRGGNQLVRVRIQRNEPQRAAG
ncbi:MAG: GGDEF domain-containing protein [Gammaproteobacteria bacterium]